MRNEQAITTQVAGEHYCDTLLEMREICEAKDLNFRLVMMDLAQRWIDDNTPEEQQGTDADQTRKT